MTERWRVIAKTTLIGALVTPFLILYAVSAAGGGHGSNTPSLVLFPYAMWANDAVHSVFLSLIIAIVQYPIYGAVIGWIMQDNQFSKWLVGFLLLGCHIWLVRFLD